MKCGICLMICSVCLLSVWMNLIVLSGVVCILLSSCMMRCCSVGCVCLVM